jgi:hypothetical protein
MTCGLFRQPYACTSRCTHQARPPTSPRPPLHLLTWAVQTFLSWRCLLLSITHEHFSLHSVSSRGISPSPVSLYIHIHLLRRNGLSDHQKLPLSNLATSSSAEPPIVSASTLSVFAASYACVASGRVADLSGRWRRVREEDTGETASTREWPSHSSLSGHLGHLGQILPICAHGSTVLCGAPGSTNIA